MVQVTLTADIYTVLMTDFSSKTFKLFTLGNSEAKTHTEHEGHQFAKTREVPVCWAIWDVLVLTLRAYTLNEGGTPSTENKFYFKQ